MNIEIIRTEDRVDAGDKPFGCKPAIAESGNVVGDGIETVGDAGNIGEPAGGHPGGRLQHGSQGIRLIRQLLHDLIDGTDEAIDEGKPTCGAPGMEITETLQHRIEFAGQSQTGGADVISKCGSQREQICFAEVEGGAPLKLGCRCIRERNRVIKLRIRIVKKIQTHPQSKTEGLTRISDLAQLIDTGDSFFIG